MTTNTSIQLIQQAVEPGFRIHQLSVDIRISGLRKKSAAFHRKFWWYTLLIFFFTPVIAQTDALSIDSAGKVGIGTNTPKNRLSVKGNADFSDRVGIGINVPTAKLEVNGRIKDSTGYLTPVGGIIMYNGKLEDFDDNGIGKISTHVQGWALCDGQAGRPDLRSAFVVGANSNPRRALPPGLSSYQINQTGGKEQYTLTVDEMPNHVHPSPRPNQGYVTWRAGGRTDLEQNQAGKPEDYSDVHPTTGGAGGGKPFDNRPPFFALFYIIKL
jgi:hypothetical protein